MSLRQILKYATVNEEEYERMIEKIESEQQELTEDEIREREEALERLEQVVAEELRNA